MKRRLRRELRLLQASAIGSVLALGFIPDALRKADRREVSIMALGAAVGIPLGTLMLVRLDALTIRWGIVGCGDVTECKSGPAFGKARNSALVAVMRRDGAKAADYAKRHNVARWYDDGAKLIADAEVDAVYVATPPDSHGAHNGVTVA